MNIRKNIIAAVAIGLLTTGIAHAEEDHAGNARNHGYETAALEVACGDMLTVTSPRLRAKLDRLYRDPESRWRDAFLDGYEGVAERKGDIDSVATPCLMMSEWLKLKPAARDLLTIKIKKAVEQRQEKTR